MKPQILDLPASQIREVANAGMARDDVLAFWFGESDEPTPQPVRDAAMASINRGETFYAQNLGLPELRDGALWPDLGRPGMGLELKRATAQRYAV